MTMDQISRGADERKPSIVDTGEKLGRAVKDDWAGRTKTVKEPKDPTLPRKARRMRQRAPLPIRPHLDRLNRTGPSHRDGWHTVPEAIIKAFAIRGVEFGNWVKPHERQANVDLAYDALHDLAEI